MGGFEIHEFHLSAGEESYTACGEPGSDERIRTVTISTDGPGVQRLTSTLIMKTIVARRTPI